MEWYKIVLAVVGCGSFIFVLIKLFFNKLIVKLDGVIETMNYQSRELKIIGAKVDANVKACEKEFGNGFSGYYDDALDQNLKVLKIKLGA